MSCRGEMAHAGSSGVGEFRTRLSLSAWLEKALYRCGSAKRCRVLETRQMSKRVERTGAGSKSFQAPPRGIVGCVRKEMLQHGTVSDPVAPLGVVAAFRVSGIALGVIVC
jgi:hypothetical protein